MQLDRSVALITGAASGLGAATALHFNRRGARVALLDRDADRLGVTAGELGGFALPADVTDPEAVQYAIKGVMSLFGALHIVVHCAGVVAGARTLGKDGAPHDLHLFAHIVQVNLIGTFNVLRLAAAAMRANTPNDDGERGVIITTASVAAFDGQIGQAAYAASKAGVAGMTLPIARDLARDGIRVVTIAPGVFETTMMANMSETVRSALEALVPFPPRLGKPEEYALLAEAIVVNPMLNGETIRLDGALRMPPK